MAIILVLGCFVLAVFDTAIVTSCVVEIIKALFGINPLGKLLQLLGRIGALAGYGYLALYQIARFWGGDKIISPVGMILTLGIPLILLLLAYLFSNDSK